LGCGQNVLPPRLLKDDIEILDPAQTLLVPDDSPKYNATMLYLESQRRRTVPNNTGIHLGHRGVMNVVPYQLDPALQALQQPRARILIADSVGMGKTLEAGVLAADLTMGTLCWCAPTTCGNRWLTNFLLVTVSRLLAQWASLPSPV
jgi:hypothetical protein